MASRAVCLGCASLAVLAELLSCLWVVAEHFCIHALLGKVLVHSSGTANTLYDTRLPGEHSQLPCSAGFRTWRTTTARSCVQQYSCTRSCCLPHNFPYTAALRQRAHAPVMGVWHYDTDEPRARGSHHHALTAVDCLLSKVPCLCLCARSDQHHACGSQVVLTVGTIVFGLYVATRILRIDVGGGGGGSSKGRGKGRRRGRFVRQSHLWLPTLPLNPSWLIPPVYDGHALPRGQFHGPPHNHLRADGMIVTGCLKYLTGCALHNLCRVSKP